MKVAITIREHYLDYINSSNEVIDTYKEKISIIAAQRDELYNFIDEHKQQLLTDYDIDLSKYKSEWEEKKYSNSNLYKIVDKIFKSDDKSSSRIVLLQLNKYLMMLKKEDEYNKLIKIAAKRFNVNGKQFKAYIKKYYTQVHKITLEGFGYRFSNKLGILLISFWKNPIDDKKHPVDFYASKCAKEKLIEQGLKPYSPTEAKKYAEMGIPYDGVEYRKYRDDAYFYDMRIYDSFKKDFISKPAFKKIEYISYKYKGLTYKEIADKYVNSMEDIYNLDVSLKNKISIMNIKYPNNYIKFIRTTNGEKFRRNKYREDNSQD